MVSNLRVFVSLLMSTVIEPAPFNVTPDAYTLNEKNRQLLKQSDSFVSPSIYEILYLPLLRQCLYNKVIYSVLIKPVSLSSIHFNNAILVEISITTGFYLAHSSTLLSSTDKFTKSFNLIFPAASFELKSLEKQKTLSE